MTIFQGEREATKVPEIHFEFEYYIADLLHVHTLDSLIHATSIRR